MSSVGLLEMNADSPMYQPTDISPLYRKRHKISGTQLKWELKDKNNRFKNNRCKLSNFLTESIF